MNAETLVDFLMFRATISEHALIVFYYLGALGVPFVSAWVAIRLARHWQAIRERLTIEADQTLPQLPARYRRRAWAAGIVMFLLMELGWRMLFEYLIAFMHMHEALLKLSQG
ncbi:MAG: DUF4282 domain-containing protein [Gammaproteobacteria bacterium]